MKYLTLALFSLISLCGAGLLLVAGYSWRGEQAIAVGELGDAPFISGFNSDEAGAPRYRWTGGNRLSGSEAVGLVTFPVSPDPTAKNLLKLQLGAALGQAASATIVANGLIIGKAQTIAGQVRDFQFDVPSEAASRADFRVEIRSPVFVPGNGDTRSLGVKVQEVRLVSRPALRLPPLDAWMWATLYVLLLGSTVFRLTGRLLVSAGIGVAGLLPWLILPYLAPRNLNLWYSPYWLPFVAGLAGLIGLFFWRAEVAGALWEFPARLEKGQLARNILLIFTLLYLIFCLIIISQMDYIGHADYADNGVVARNLVQGRGLSADYAAQFYLKYPSLPRPADTWPPLQPLLIAPFFWLFGPTAFAAKLPNLLLMAGLVWAIFYYGIYLFNRRVALAAALLCLGAPAFFETVVYPINDLSFTLLTWLSLCSLYRAVNEFRVHPTGRGSPTGPPYGLKFKVQSSKFTHRATLQAEVQGSPDEPKFGADGQIEPRKKAIRHWTLDIKHWTIPWMLAGVWAGLLFLSKPSGGVLLVGAGLWLLYQKFRHKELIIPWRGLFIWGGVALLLISPWLIRNLLQFQTPFYSTEQRDGWLLKYYPPDERIYDLYYTDPARPLPVPNLLLVYGFDTVFKAIGLQFAKSSNDLINGTLVAPLLLGLVGLGLAVVPRRRASLIGLVTLAFVAYILFINIYWHYEIRYFMALLPWLYAFGLYGLTWIYDKTRTDQQTFNLQAHSKQAEIEEVSSIKNENAEIKEAQNDLKPSYNSGFGLKTLLLPGVFLLLWLPGVLAITDSDNIRGYTGRTGIVLAAEWLKQNTPADSRVMSRNIWELSFHSQRQGAMIPNTASLNEIKQVMHDYNVRYLQLDHTNLDDRGRPDYAAWDSRRALWPLIRKEVDANGQVGGFKKIYDDKFGFIIYELVEN